jgi:hypothetical protein
MNARIPGATDPAKNTETPRVRFEDVPVFAPFFIGVQPYLKVSATQYVGWKPDAWPNDFHKADELVTLTLPTAAERLAALDEARAAWAAAGPHPQWCNKHREWTDSPDSAKCWVCVDEEETAASSSALLARAEKAERERDEARLALAVARRERDEARARCMVRGASLLELLILIVGLGVAGLVACASIGAALSERDAARAYAAAEERRADEATAALARLNNRAHELAEHVRTHLAIDDEQCCSCGGAE